MLLWVSDLLREIEPSYLFINSEHLYRLLQFELVSWWKTLCTSHPLLTKEPLISTSNTSENVACSISLFTWSFLISSSTQIPQSASLLIACSSSIRDLSTKLGVLSNPISKAFRLCPCVFKHEVSFIIVITSTIKHNVELAWAKLGQPFLLKSGNRDSHSRYTCKQSIDRLRGVSIGWQHKCSTY